MAFENVGKVWTPASLSEYLKKRVRPSWIDSITMHHTAEPSLKQRPNGLTIQHIINIREYYKKPKEVKGKMKPGWKSGPHLFIDEDEVFGMCDFASKGVHAVSFNASSLGIEVLGFYDKDIEDPKSGRGLRCWMNAAATVRVLLDWLALAKSNKTILFHRDDPETTKSCPGTAVTKDWFLDLIPGTVPDPVHGLQPFDKPDVGIPWSKWHFAGEQWCVPVLEFLVAKGLPSAQVIAALKAKDGKLFYGNEMIDGGFYVAQGGDPKPDAATWAPARELMEIGL
jgi:hypothetical protein